MNQHFEPENLQLFEEIEEVEIETRSSERGEPHRAIVWVVVVGADVYVRSVNGHEGHWYQHLIAKSPAAINAQDQRIAVSAVPVADASTQQQVSDAYRRKYALYPQDVAWIVGSDVAPTTMRLEPKPHHAAL
jgi:hypothetical protein